jgi:hypothetical protein
MAAGTDLPRADQLALTGNTREEITRTVQNVWDFSQNEDDARFLLDVLGLLPKTAVTDHGLDGYLAECRCRICRKAHRTHQRYHATREVTP